jgi:hypothetical protein
LQELPNPRAAMQADDVPELPDISAYITALESRIVGQPLERIRLASPFCCGRSSPSSRAQKAAPLKNCGALASALPSA